MALHMKRDKKHGQKEIDKLLDKHRWDEAIVAAIEWASAVESGPGSVYAPGETVRKIATAAAGSDDTALETIIRIIRQEFRDCGPPGVSGPVETDATDAIELIGPRAAPLLLPLLDDPRWMVASNAMTGLGIAGDVSVVPRIAEIHASTADRHVAGVDMWGTEMRSSSFVACANLFGADPEGYTAQAMAVPPRHREMLGVAARFSAGDPPKSWSEARRRDALAFAAKIRGKVVQTLSDGDTVSRNAPVDTGETRLAVEMDQTEPKVGGVVTGRARLRGKHDRLVHYPNASLSVEVDGELRDTVTTDSEGEARLRLVIDEPGRHKIRVVYAGDDGADGRRVSGSEQTYGIKVKP